MPYCRTRPTPPSDPRTWGRYEGAGRASAATEQRNGRERPVKLFACQSCQQIVFFESVSCTKCGHALAFAPDRGADVRARAGAAVWNVDGRGGTTGTSSRTGSAGTRSSTASATGSSPTGERRLLPGLPTEPHHPKPRPAETPSRPGHRLEGAKRRVLYTLFAAAVAGGVQARQARRGLEFEVSAGFQRPRRPARLHRAQRRGHHHQHRRGRRPLSREDARADGGDLPHRARPLPPRDRPLLLGPVGQGHAAPGPSSAQLFGDERADYAAAQKQHYATGYRADWPQRFVSAYASMHPWEDWAESWAHYLHIVDTLETARAFSMSLRPVKEEAPRPSELALAARRLDLHSFEELIAGWIPLDHRAERLEPQHGHERRVSLRAARTAVEKLRFVHDTIAEHRSAHGAAPGLRASIGGSVPEGPSCESTTAAATPATTTAPTPPQNQARR